MSKSGFSTIELLIALVVFSLVMAIGGPRLATAYQKKAARLSADQFVSSFSLARSTAVRYGRRAELHIDATNSAFWVEVDTSGVGGTTDTVGFIRRFPEVRIASNVSLFCFDLRGLLTKVGSCQAGSETITFSNDVSSKTVSVTTLGKVLR